MNIISVEVDFPYHFRDRNEIMLQFLMNIDLRQHKKFNENPIKTLRERTIRNLTIKKGAPQSYNHLKVFIFTSFKIL